MGPRDAGAGDAAVSPVLLPGGACHFAANRTDCDRKGELETLLGYDIAD